jgi:hypothetical protein
MAAASSSYGFGYGANPRCSLMQYKWQTAHPLFLSVARGRTIKDVLRGHPLLSTIGNPSVLLPLTTPSLWHDEPQLINYVQLPMHLWVPEFFAPHLLSSMPCPVDGCTSSTSRQRWHSGGPRLIHGMHSAMYLHCWEYQCSTHNKTSFSGWDHRCLMKMPDAVYALFRFVLTGEDGVTLELYNRIVEMRVTGSSLHVLARDINRNRHGRMYEAMAMYYQDCERHKLARQPKLTRLWGGAGASHKYDPFPPLLHNPAAYYDHPAPSVHFMAELCNRFSANREDLWTRYTQQLTADQVCIDSTFKIPMRMQNSSGRMVWSMMDIRTGCILHQQLLTHEKHADLLPMMTQYASRARELGVALPSRVCSDRGLMDANIINHPLAFPAAHINVDPWHFHALFTKALCKENGVWKKASSEFGASLYTVRRKANGQSVRSHAEPQVLVDTVDGIMAKYSFSGGAGMKPAVGQEAKEWWTKQKQAILERRVCSNPAGDDSSGCISSSPLENYHRQVNRLMHIVRCTEETMHGFLLHFMFRWNVDRRRKAKLEQNWCTYDFVLLDGAFQACVRVVGQDEAGTLWGVRAVLPPVLRTREHFGLRHPNVTLAERLGRADHHLPFSDELLDVLADDITEHVSIIPDAQLVHLVRTTADVLVENIGNDCQRSATDTAGNVVRMDQVDVQTQAALSSRAQVASSSPSSAQSLPQPPRRKMTKTELTVLSRIIQKDPLMRDAVTASQWDTAAARWNSFVVRCCTERRLSPAIRSALHAVHGETLRSAAIQLEQQQDQAMQQSAIELKSTMGPAWKVVTITEQPFLSIEAGALLELTKKNRKKPRGGGKEFIDWTCVEVAWLSMWRSQHEAGQANCFFPRDIATLKSHHQTLMKRVSASTATATATDSTPAAAAQPHPHPLSLTIGSPSLSPSHFPSSSASPIYPLPTELPHLSAAQQPSPCDAALPAAME